MSIAPLYPHFSLSFNKKSMKENLFFTNSGRSAFELIIRDLKSKYSELIFLIPAYTCPTVVFALISEEVNFDFVDLDETLDFDLQDLESQITNYKTKKIVIVATALFGITLRDYKKLYEDLLLIEDRAQCEFNYKSEADYQFVSFGRGKLISSFNGGAVYTKVKSFFNIYNEIPVVHGFIVSYILTLLQGGITKFFYFLIEKSFLNPERKESVNFSINFPSKISKTKMNWLLNSIDSLDNTIRKEKTIIYQDLISKEYTFPIKAEYLLRFPIRKKIDFTGVSHIYDYRYTYEVAKKRRGRELLIPFELSYSCSFLPTHRNVDEKYILKVVELINE